MRPYKEGEKKKMHGDVAGWLTGLGTWDRAAERGEIDEIIFAAKPHSSFGSTTRKATMGTNLSLELVPGVANDDAGSPLLLLRLNYRVL